MSTVFLFRPARELGCEELHRRHVWNQVVDVVLRKVTAVGLTMRFMRAEQKLSYAHAKSSILADMSAHGLELACQEFDARRRKLRSVVAKWPEQDSTHSVDFPAPLGPTTAIRESRPTSILMSFSKILSGVYPNEASFNCSTGGEIFSVSGNLNVSVSSTSGGCNSGSCARHT